MGNYSSVNIERNASLRTSALLGWACVKVLAMKKIGIYVQVPFCQTRCTYCNFHTGVVAAERFGPYVEAVKKEISGERPARRVTRLGGQASGPPRRAGEQENSTDSAGSLIADTVYIGGGTPSLLEPKHLKAILDVIHERFGGELEEVTLEADPETVTKEKAAAWVAAGINRASLGVQSFVDGELAAAGRKHRREDVYRAAKILRAAGLANISFDLIAGLAHQTKESWTQSLEELVGLTPEHVSIYLLEVDEGSRLGKEVLAGGKRYGAGAVPSDDEMAEFYEEACRRLEGLGYHHYEISNWAKPGFESRHNLKYWRREPYLGFGAGAHSFSGSERWANVHDAAEYVAAIAAGKRPVEQQEVLTEEGALEEELFLGLRQLDGIDLRKVEREYGVDLGSRFDSLVAAGLVEREGDCVRLASGRVSVSNEVFVELMR
jgi:oxygen-independent coproporphyrinogen III oxidase